VNRARAYRWSRTAFALAALFASFPIVGRLVLGEWAFEGAGGIAGLWLIAGSYLYVRARRLAKVEDGAALLDEAIHLASTGDAEKAIRVLDRAIRENPTLWQAYQYRGELRMQAGETEKAIEDIEKAIELAPEEPHLYELRRRAEEMLLGPRIDTNEHE
jgi:tetratricopeptide (TPR) repeat protein